MFEETGKPRVLLNGRLGLLLMGELESDNTGHVALFKGKETVRLGLGSLTLSDETAKQTAYLGASDSGSVLDLTSDTPRLTLGTQSGYRTEIGSTDLVTVGGGVSHRTSAASIVLFNPSGNLIWSAEQGDVAIGYLDSRTQSLQLTVDDSKRELSDLKEKLDSFEAVACPLLRTADLNWTMKMKLNRACGAR
jgi:hypothetical protein